MKTIDTVLRSFCSKGLFRSFILIFLTTATLSCKKDIDFNGTITEPFLVVNALLTPDSLLSVRVTESRFFLDDNTDYTSVDNAEVQLYVNNVLKEKMPFKGEGFYQSNDRPAVGENIRLVVSAPGFTSVGCEVQIPEKSNILALDSSSTIENYYYTNQTEYTPTNWTIDTTGVSSTRNYTFSLKFRDPVETSDYYRLNVTEQVTYANGLIYTTYSTIETNDIVFGDQTGDLTIEMGSSNLSNKLFTDELLNGNDYTLKFNYEDTGSTWYINDYGYYGASTGIVKKELVIDLQKISKGYYLYLKTSEAALNEGDIFTEPVQVYNNIQGGLGILGSYSSNIIRVELPL